MTPSKATCAGRYTLYITRDPGPFGFGPGKGDFGSLTLDIDGKWHGHWGGYSTSTLSGTWSLEGDKLSLYHTHSAELLRDPEPRPNPTFILKDAEVRFDNDGRLSEIVSDKDSRVLLQDGRAFYFRYNKPEPSK